MHITKVFKNGNLQAVCIPADLAYERNDIEIERVGDEIRIRPARQLLDGVLKKFTKFGRISRPKDVARKNKLIAAHSVALDVSHLTNNECDFVRYPGVKVENWLKD